VSLLDALILGLVQGLTEFLPISSSAHVQLVQGLLATDLSKPELTAFIATIQLGTELAVLIYFWKDITRIIAAWFKNGFSKSPSADAKMGWLVIIGSLPVVIAGLLFKDIIETDLRNLWIVSFTLIVFGLLLGLADYLGKKSKPITDLTTRHGIVFGLGQMLAVIPGVSRSGGTITAGLLLGYTREASARYSFLLAIPAVLASGFYEFAKTYQDLPSTALLSTALATLVSFLVGLAVIAYLLKYLAKGSFTPFVVWRIAVGVLILVLLNTGVVSA
jgi:undecaprenyl-diphosphatase